MPSTSVIGAELERLESLTLPAGTTVWFDEAPLKVRTGDPPVEVEVLPPYVVLKDDGTTPGVTVEGLPYEITRSRFEVYGRSLAEADAIALAIKYNGRPISAFAGMDQAASLPLTDQDYKGMLRKHEQRFQETGRGRNARPVFRVTMAYAASAARQNQDPATLIILTITGIDGGPAVVTTAAPHGLSELYHVVVSGTSNGVYNATWLVTGFPSATTFELATDYLGDATGGAWRLA